MAKLFIDNYFHVGGDEVRFFIFSKLIIFINLILFNNKNIEKWRMNANNKNINNDNNNNNNNNNEKNKDDK